MGKYLVLMVFFYSFSIAGQELKPVTLELKEERPLVFEAIEDFAAEKWKTRKMFIYELNRQCRAFTKVCELIKKYPSKNKTCLEAIRNWSDQDTENVVFPNPSIDWGAVLFEINSRLDPRTGYR